MLAFFDFYPIITQNDSFFELYRETLFWIAFNRWNYLILLISVFAARPLVRIIPLKTAVQSLFLSILVLGTWITMEYFFRQQLGWMSLYGKLSDHYYQFTESVMLLFLIHIPLGLAYFFGRKSASKNPFQSKFAGSSQLIQTTILTSAWLTLISFPFAITAITLVVTSFGLFKVSKKDKTGTLSPVQLKDAIPVIVLLSLFVFLGFLSVGDVACNIPYLNECFTCRYY